MRWPSKRPDISAGPNERAGFIDPPVTGPIAMIPAATVNPIARPPIFGPFGSTAVPKTTKTRKNVAIASSAKP